jgi:hypothetical protein
MKISVRRFMVAMILIGTGIGASIAAWKSDYLFNYHPVGAAFAFFHCALPAGAGVSLLATRRVATFVITTIVIAWLASFIQWEHYMTLFYRE